MLNIYLRVCKPAICVLALFAVSAQLWAQGNPAHPDKQAVIDHWTPARIAAAQPRDLVIDAQGKGYLRRADGSLVPYGLEQAASVGNGNNQPSAMGRPSGGDTQPSIITNMQPVNGTSIAANATFSASVTDPNGLKSVEFFIADASGNTQGVSANHSGGDVWTANVGGLAIGTGSWYVRATDNSSRRGNITRSNSLSFTVSGGGDTGGGGSGAGEYVVPNSQWTLDGAVQTAVGRIYFEMPSNRKFTRWGGYVCSGSVVNDATTGRSIILTAAHCVYDDANKAFARNVLFIPNQAGTTGTGTDGDCNNDPLGCWAPSFGVVDINWTTRTFPDNVAWDYAYYVVADSGAHAGAAANPALDNATATLPLSFAVPAYSDGVSAASSPDFTHALGYSYDVDPNFMYCADDMTEDSSVNWWLPSCGLSGGASGGPWVQPMGTDGSGPVISVNSWGYTGSPGMAGPHLSGTSAECLFLSARDTAFASVSTADGKAGLIPGCP